MIDSNSFYVSIDDYVLFLEMKALYNIKFKLGDDVFRPDEWKRLDYLWYENLNVKSIMHATLRDATIVILYE